MSDELTPQELEFLHRWENLGKDEKAQETSGLGGLISDEDLPEGEIEEGEGEGFIFDDDRKSEIQDEEEQEPPQEQEGELDHELEGEEYDEQNEHVRDQEPPQSDEKSEEDKIEEDDGEGERGNSDEERKSEEPIKPPEEPPKEDQKTPEDKSSENDRQDGVGGMQSRYDDLPEQPEQCDDHCEDNEPDDEDAKECPHCTERIRREREEWGVIATDMRGQDVLPGDKLRVAVPVPFHQSGAVLTANVPNEHEERFCVSTSGDEDHKSCWLSGRISEFTGWHMAKGGPVHRFEKDSKLRFVEKIGEITGLLHDDEDDLIKNLQDDLEKFGGEKSEEPPKDEKIENGDEDEDEEIEDEEEEDDREEEREEDDEEEEEEHHHRNSKYLTATQKKRFEKLFDRIAKKVAQTFGNTAEVTEIGDVYLDKDGEIVARPYRVISRGVVYHFVFTAARYHPEES